MNRSCKLTLRGMVTMEEKSAEAEEEHDEVRQSEKVALERERLWLLRRQTNSSLSIEPIRTLLLHCCRKLTFSNKFNHSGATTSPERQQQQRVLNAEKVVLASRNSDALRCTLSLLGDNITQVEVAIRYRKVAGGMFRSIAQPDVQWKLEQLSDCEGHLIKAVDSLQSFDEVDDDVAGRRRDVDELYAHLENCRSSLTLPKRRSLEELRQFRPNRCFVPPLPADLLLSVYVSSSRLVCAAYQLQQQAAAGGPPFTLTQADCQMTYLIDVLQLLTAALHQLQQIRDKLALFSG